jgi:hypothetical protein
MRRLRAPIILARGGARGAGYDVKSNFYSLRAGCATPAIPRAILWSWLNPFSRETHL